MAKNTRSDAEGLMPPDREGEAHAEARRRAESLIAAGASGLPASPADGDGHGDADSTQRLLHELGVHQIELELQNEELQLAQQALEASRDRYFDLYENAPVAYLSFDLAGCIVESNRAARRLFGLARGEFEHRRVVESIAIEQRPQFQRHVMVMLADGGEQAFETALALPHRAPCWVAVRMSVVDSNAQHPRIRAALIDITERVAAQEEVAGLAAVVASSEDAIVSRDAAGRVTTWNEGAERLFGRTAAQMVGRTMDELVPAAQREREAEMLQRALKGRSSTLVQTERLDARGHVRPLSVSLSPIRTPGGEVAGSALIARDVSELRSVERALDERVRQLDLLAQAGQELILGDSVKEPLPRRLFESVGRAVGGDIHLSYAIGEKPATLELRDSTGLPAATRAEMAVVSVDDSLCGMVVERRAPLVIESLQSAALPQARVLKAAGALAYAGFPLMANERLYGVAAFASTTHDRFDGNDLQVIETVCRQASAMLERSELLQELHANESALKAADRAKDEFIAILAHELRNPLAPIRNALAILRRDDGDADPRRTEWCREIIDRQVVHMTHLLEDLLDVSRVTRNQIQLRCADIDLKRAVMQAVETARPLFEVRRHRLALELPEEPVPFHGDLTRLTQIFTNMLTNAGKYTDPRGEIALSLRVEPAEIVVAVRDNGIGIEPGQLSRVFQMFAQLTPALERSAGGLGIGLALTRGLVELHHGTIEARSEGPGKGSEFVVRLPRPALSDGPDGAARAAASATTAAPKRLLVVDDNFDAATSLGELLALQGHEVRTAFSGREGLRVAQEWQPQALLLDIGMADLNGYELCRRIRAEPWGRDALLIACTGWGQEADRARAQEAGFDVHLVKPIEPASLGELLARNER
ncbi:MAG TPA: PAS domain S-box protein [Methylibium sp.]|uniref:hybrid sensor histidine kinase/response regulator n=1 Tax=Methylibium sp. TaxID=2067992 RepID=UPI002DBA75D5|nr:PAS domain S-box protein [Methylibium sp.]HEU4460038.1 PAS domain S-box protein [Methylibium sp.]